MPVSLTKNQKEELTRSALSYFKKYRSDEVAKYAQAPGDVETVTVDWEELFRHDHGLAEDLLNHPELINAFEAAVERYDLPVPIDDATVRLSNVGDEEVLEVYELRKDRIGELVAINGQVAQISENRIEVKTGVFRCRRCGTTATVAQDDETGEVQEPNECHGCERSGPFKLLHDDDETVHRDFQMARLEIPPELTTQGDGQTIDVLLYDDLLGKLSVGDRVEVIGEVLLEENEGRFDMLLKAHGVDQKENNFEALNIDDYREEIRALSERDDLYQALIDSLAPQIVGGDRIDNIKLALMLAAFGTNTRPLGRGESKIRGTPHILLLGDPGVGKSEMLEYLESVCPRSVFASGDAATGPGLTGAVVRDDFGPGEWVVKAGALPRAHGGVACVDEIDKTDDETLQVLHTALQKLEVRLSKAASATLPSETTLLAAGNPKHGRFDPDIPYAEQIDLEPALMSRFDLMFMMKDEPDEEKDTLVAETTLDAFQRSAEQAADDTRSVAEAKGLSEIDPDLLKAYIAYAREHVDPVLTDAAKEQLQEFYVTTRQSNSDEGGGNSPVPVTARKNGGGARLAEASARARLSKTATLEDAKRAIGLIEMSMQDVGLDPKTGKFDADVVETGVSRTQRRQHGMLREIICEVALEDDEPGADFSRVISEAVAEGMDADEAERELKNLDEAGRVWHPHSRDDRINTDRM